MKTILVVDDEFGFAEALSSALTDEGYRVSTAQDGRQGWLAVKDIKPDLLLTDFMMPISDGPTLIRELRASEAFEAVPVILMSAVAEAQVRALTTEYQVFLRKPFDLRSLLAALKKLLP